MPTDTEWRLPRAPRLGHDTARADLTAAMAQSAPCWYCHGTGYVLTCADGICPGCGDCSHGYRSDICAACNGSGDCD